MKYLFIVWLQICSFYLFASDNKNPFISELNEDSTSELSDKQKIELKECMEQGRPWHTKENKCLEWDNIVIHSTPHDSTSNASKKQELSVTEKQNLIAKKVLYTTLINVEGQEVLPLKLLFKSLPRKMDIILDDLVLIYMKNLSTNEDINEIVNGLRRVSKYRDTVPPHLIFLWKNVAC